ncbi:uncharacterized protein DS421_13g418080 [Arachis hypogaea]|nr:uncharacterized protein DS421_13g418080 [Arachis hypogaea]
MTLAMLMPPHIFFILMLIMLLVSSILAAHILISISVVICVLIYLVSVIIYLRYFSTTSLTSKLSSSTFSPTPKTLQAAHFYLERPKIREKEKRENFEHIELQILISSKPKFQTN